jgi:synaptobrevin family protein YKT6
MYKFHSLGHNTGVVGIVVADHDYPMPVAQALLTKVVDEFTTKYPKSAWERGNPTLPFPELDQYLVKYQDPAAADSIMRIQKELDETKVILHKTIESVLERGEKIDNLVQKSEGLSAQSKMFYSKTFPWPCCNRIMD